MSCIFCKIVAGEIPSKVVYEDELIYVFHDIQPVRPVHLLVIPKKHIDSLAEVQAEDEAILGRMLSVASKLAVQAGAPKGFRTVINTGEYGGQEVYHLHMHIIGDTKPLGGMVKRDS